MKNLVFLFTVAFFLTAANIPCRADDNSDVSIESDLVEILDSFDNKKGHDPYDTSALKQVYKASGTLVFFDNSNSTGQKPKIGMHSRSAPSHMMEKTLQKARKRFFGIKKDETSDAKNAPVFSDRRKIALSDIIDENAPRKRHLKVLGLQYNGEKTFAPIPPDTIIEVPFLKHIPYFFSRIEILGNGSLKVTETIERVVEPGENVTGIDRFFPKYYIDRTGKKHRTHLTVLEASVNNRPVEAKLLPDINGIRIALHSDTVLPAETNIFRITYLFPNKILQFKNSDETAPDFKELIWEITGNHWDTRSLNCNVWPWCGRRFLGACICRE